MRTASTLIAPALLLIAGCYAPGPSADDDARGEVGSPMMTPSRPAPGSTTRVCAINESQCGSECVDLRNDPRNCGDCAIRCDQGATCMGGRCVTTRICDDPTDEIWCGNGVRVRACRDDGGFNRCPEAAAVAPRPERCNGDDDDGDGFIDEDDTHGVPGATCTAPEHSCVGAMASPLVLSGPTGTVEVLSHALVNQTPGAVTAPGMSGLGVAHRLQIPRPQVVATRSANDVRLFRGECGALTAVEPLPLTSTVAPRVTMYALEAGTYTMVSSGQRSDEVRVAVSWFVAPRGAHAMQVIPWDGVAPLNIPFSAAGLPRVAAEDGAAPSCGNATNPWASVLLVATNPSARAHLVGSTSAVVGVRTPREDFGCRTVHEFEFDPSGVAQLTLSPLPGSTNETLLRVEAMR